MTVKVNMLLVSILYWGIEFETKTLIEVLLYVKISTVANDGEFYTLTAPIN